DLAEGVALLEQAIGNALIPHHDQVEERRDLDPPARRQIEAVKHPQLERLVDGESGCGDQRHQPAPVAPKGWREPLESCTGGKTGSAHRCRQAAAPAAASSRRAWASRSVTSG